jgi:tubulin---tyrosine ligase
LTTVNGNLQGYWYNEGYLRTSSKDFNLKNVTNRLIHLTNDAVQKKSDDYGKFESGNKVILLIITTLFSYLMLISRNT